MKSKLLSLSFHQRQAWAGLTPSLCSLERARQKGNTIHIRNPGRISIPMAPFAPRPFAGRRTASGPTATKHTTPLLTPRRPGSTASLSEPQESLTQTQRPHLLHEPVTLVASGCVSSRPGNQCDAPGVVATELDVPVFLTRMLSVCSGFGPFTSSPASHRPE